MINRTHNFSILFFHGFATPCAFLPPPFPHTVVSPQGLVMDFTKIIECQISLDLKISRLNFQIQYLVLLRFQDDEEKYPRKPKLYVSIGLAEFRDEVVKCILREMRQEESNWKKEMSPVLIADEIRYDVTEDIREYQKVLKSHKQSLQNKRTERSRSV